ncbi:MAG: malate synthase A [Pseudomonadota bacterium]|nr:MAG: malate synthase A [Pseudomonadota bacterium]
MSRAARTTSSSHGIDLRGAASGPYADILTPDAVAFVADLARRFGARRDELLARRAARQRQLDAGQAPDFLAETASVRAGDWTVAPVPADLVDRRVEITGPVERKMIVNALNCGANVFMADYEDSLAPTWDNVVQGQINVHDAVRHEIEFDSDAGKHYELRDRIATLMVRPRGWHLDEKHLLVDGKPVPAGLFDFGLHCYHNARELLARGSGPYFYLPKMESHLEARLWNDVFLVAQETLGIPRGTIKATVLIETILAAFEMDEILYELREHSAGLNCGRWDYIFSVIKKFRNRPDFVLADRARVTMTVPFMRAYSQLLIKTCHRRGAHAMGGMAAQIPIKDDAKANAEALARVRADKERESNDGHDGTWIAHPGLLDVACNAFNVMAGPNQLSKKREDVKVTAADLLAFGPAGPITEAGVRTNIDVGIQYLGSWLVGNGCVPIHHLMEDAATAEISRSQLWHWVRSSKGVLDDGRKITLDMIREFLPQELSKVREHLGEKQFATGKYELAAKLLEDFTATDEFAEFLTLPGYEYLD